MLTNEDRKQIMETIIGILSHIADKEYQKRIWIRGEGPEVDDFDETVCNFFQGGEGIIERYKDFGLTEYQHHILQEFKEKFDEFNHNNDLPQEFIDTPEWAKIMDLAKEVLKAFNYKKE